MGLLLTSGRVEVVNIGDVEDISNYPPLRIGGAPVLFANTNWCSSWAPEKRRLVFGGWK